MGKVKLIRQTLDILTKVFVSFILVFAIYFISNMVNDFAINYFIFPLISIVIIFMCGVNVGKSLEKMKNNEKIGFFTRNCNDEKAEESCKTEFVINNVNRLGNNKKVLKEVKCGDKIHLKVFNYDDVEDIESE